ncbi:hypothetical protein SDC9_199171 [bioreactor metagenome]|uniref:Uncharacterized protein n=1 Tax=bioreactor metagenome TaxID=1076179 RepID=A0A645IWF4_9ZZZZ
MALQILLAAGKLVFRRWTFTIATVNLIINALSLVLIFAILDDVLIFSNDFLVWAGELSPLGSSGSPIIIGGFLIFFKLVFLISIIVNSIQGFYRAYKAKLLWK